MTLLTSMRHVLLLLAEATAAQQVYLEKQDHLFRNRELGDEAMAGLAEARRKLDEINAFLDDYLDDYKE